MREILQQAVAQLRDNGCETPQLDAEVLLAHALGCERNDLYTTTNWSQAPAGIWETFQNYIQRRKRREPVAYIVGYKEFWSIPIKVTPDVLIPRPETEALVEKSLKLLEHRTWNPSTALGAGSEHRTILDLCTGSGCIAAALAKELPNAKLVVSDISKKALKIAEENLAFVKERVTFLQSDLFEKIEGEFDLIVTNPPYVAASDWQNLAPEIKNYEPKLALDGGADGLDFIRKIRQDAPNYLKPNGWLILENGPNIQTWNVSSLKAANHYRAA